MNSQRNLFVLFVAATLMLRTNSEGQTIDSSNWEGNTWAQNLNLGSWFPTVSSGNATFTANDVSWNQIRSLNNYSGSLHVVFDVNPSLSSGGYVADEALFGFGQDWFYYHQNPDDDQWPGSAPASLGVRFQGGNVFIRDGYGASIDVQHQIGTYSAGQWVTVVMDLSASGYLQVTGPGFGGNYQATTISPSAKFIAALANSSDGFQLRNVTVVVPEPSIVALLMILPALFALQIKRR